MTDSDTLTFTVPSDDKESMRRILRSVFDALSEKGYNPINQIVAYLLTEEQKAAYEQLLNVSGLGIMGYIEIPSIDCSLPIYHGTEESVLQIGRAHV